MHLFTFTADEDDSRSIHEAIAYWQLHVCDVADGEGDLKGRILGEICRSFVEYHQLWKHEHPKPMENDDDSE